MFTKGDNFRDFLFAYVENEVFQNGVYSDRKEFVPKGANSFLYEMTQFIWEAKVAFPESVPFTIKIEMFRIH